MRRLARSAAALAGGTVVLVGFGLWLVLDAVFNPEQP